jgi:hypothetical protein
MRSIDQNDEPPAQRSAQEELGILNPADVRLEDGPAGLLSLHLPDRSYPQVIAAWAFPFTDRRHWVGFRDEDDKPIGMIQDIAELDRQSRAVLQRALERRYFLPRITRVFGAREEFGLLTLDVETDRGRIKFTVNNPRENIHWIGQGRVLFVDAEENRYEVPHIEELDARSQSMLYNVL